MYAIIADGGRQYKVVEGQILDIDFREVAEGDELTFDRVLAISNGETLNLGQPVVVGAKVTAIVAGDIKGDKIYPEYFRRRKNSHKRIGHRQKYVRVKIEKIAG
jgi:large subunit ribosomal protein L21